MRKVRRFGSCATGFAITVIACLFSPMAAKAHVRLDYPEAGEAFAGGETVEIQWDAFIFHGPGTIDLAFSGNGGLSYTPIVAGAGAGSDNPQEPEIVRFATKDGGRIKAALFAGKKDRAVILAHGAVFDKESWYPQARVFRKAGLTCLAIDFRSYGKSTAGSSREKYHDVLGAVVWLKEQGYKHIAVVGGSMGGAAVLRALSHTDDSAIDKALLLAPAGGDPIASDTVKKLFVVSEGDGVVGRVRALHEASSDPKELRILSGKAHAQHIFKTPQGKELMDAMLTFLLDKPDTAKPAE